MYWSMISVTSWTFSSVTSLIWVWTSSKRSTSVSWNLKESSISMLRTSLTKALNLKVDLLLILIRLVALFIKSESFSKFEMNFLKASMKFRSALDLSLSEITLIVIASLVARRRIISVTNRVQRLSLRGKEISVSISRTELLPTDWSLHTTSWERNSMLSRSHLRSWSTMLSTFRCSSLWRSFRDVVIFNILDEWSFSEFTRLSTFERSSDSF